MMDVGVLPLDDRWKDYLDLSRRQAPELYERTEEVRDTPYAHAIRTTLDDLGASAVFCVQKVPTAVICVLEKYDGDKIIDLHAKLWNQGLASLLLVLDEDAIVRVFSLARIPPRSVDEPTFNERCLVKQLEVTVDALELKNIIYGIESGRLWKQHKDYFRPEERIDQILLNNLSKAHKSLCEDLPVAAAQTLLIQTMFIAYLEDRKIVGKKHFSKTGDVKFDSFRSLLESKSVASFNKLFKSLKKDFNGDLFVAPCSFDADPPPPTLRPDHLAILADFRSGNLEMDSGQYRFWGYHFKYIPIELISAVYDRFLGESKESRRTQGAYYTPMFLANTVVSQVWDTLTNRVDEKRPFNSNSRFLDPACGSGVFLVQCFQRLCEHWRETRRPQTIRWDSLVAILQRLHGWDLNSDAVRVAVFSLYVAFLENVSPPDIRTLIEKGRLLPKLWGETLCGKDFFEAQLQDFHVDIVIGNPPWRSRRGSDRSSVTWCTEQNLPMPNKEVAWGFVWKSLRHLSENGLVAFLLPAMGFLHNDQSAHARGEFAKQARIIRIIDFSDLRFQLFDSAIGPAALVMYRGHHCKDTGYQFDYWSPKADINLKTKRLITLSRRDKNLIASHMVQDNPMAFKNRFWMNGPEGKLFNYIKSLPKIDDLIDVYSKLKNKTIRSDKWLIGQGFQPAQTSRLNEDGYGYIQSEIVARTPYLPIEIFRTLAQDFDGLLPWRNGDVYTRGFEKGFDGPRILVTRGVSTTQWRLRASYVQNPGTFQHIIMAICVPRGEERRAKLLTALLNSRLLLWFAFHDTSPFGIERPEVSQNQLLRLPFPSSENLPDRTRSESAGNSLIKIIDDEIRAVNDTISLGSLETGSQVFKKIDCLAYDYFCLSDEEIILVEDTAAHIIPAAQPRKASYPDIWKPSSLEDRKAYADVLVRSLKEWFDENHSIHIMLEARADDLAILRLSLEDSRSMAPYNENNDHRISAVLERLSENIHHSLPGNFQLVPDFRLFHDNNLYLVKPIQKRFWLRSTAIADADAIALDLHEFSGLSTSRSKT